ncbi:MAG: hypothetical protein VXW65_03625 [Pseudomonadota bacterium]|nr:hypothetical protein [Pseudomonadota bacterium]
MLPDNVLSSDSQQADFLLPIKSSKVTDLEWGGVAVQDTSQGLRVKIWQAYLDGDNVMIVAPEVPPTVLFSAAGITELALAFDQNMRPAVAYRQSGTAKLWWYDSTIADMTVTDFGDCRDLHLTLDDNRPNQISVSDIIFGYIRDNALYYRQQRDRYETEYLLSAVAQDLTMMGMMTNQRMGFSFTTLSTLSDDIALVDSRNNPALDLDYLDLIPQQAAYSAAYGVNTLSDKQQLGTTYLRSAESKTPSMVNIGLVLNGADYDYLMAFYRVWRYRCRPFYVSLKLDDGVLTKYKCHFMPKSVRLDNKSGMAYTVSATLEVLSNPDDADADLSLIVARNPDA